MVKKLLSVLQNQGLRLVLEALFFFFALLWVYGSGFRPFPLIVFLGLSAFFYFRTLEGSKRFLSSFLLLILFSFFVSHSFLAFLFAVLFYLLLGVKKLFFIRRDIAYYFVHTSLLLIGFTYFFLGQIPFPFLFLGIFLFYREFFKVLVVSPVQRLAFTALVLAFVGFQFAWLITLLPLGPFAGSGLLVSLLFVLSELILHSFTHTLRRELVLRGITVFASIMILVFFISDVFIFGL